MWKHPNTQAIYISQYKRVGIDRLFVLIPKDSQGQPFSFPSAFEAKKAGWQLLKRKTS
jgi:hypothetical protein